MRYFIEIAYDGTAYHGWQIQNGETTVQQMLEKGMLYKLGCNERITGCGRTDSGVHARQFYAHFDLGNVLDASQMKKAVDELNSFLPSDIAVRRIFHVSQDAHARFDAVSRTYKYYIKLGKDPFFNLYSWPYRANLDVEAMNRAAALLLDFSDFASFAKLHTDTKTNNCKITRASWSAENDMLVFTITADRFLRNMVRAIVGTLVDVGRVRRSVDDFRRILLSKDRGVAGMSAPARGLFLHSVDYPRVKIFPQNEGST